MVNYSCMQNVKLMVGENCHTQMGEALQEAGYRKAFVVYDSGVKAAGIIDKVLDSLKAAGLEVVEFDKVLPDPPAEIVNEGARLCEAAGCDCVVGIGGGSDMEARTKMHVAASMGGWMLANSSAHVGHSIAHVIGGMYHIPHGACCAYSLPVVLETVSAVLPDKVKAIGVLLGVSFAGTEDAVEIGRKTAEAYRKFAYETVGVKPVRDYVTEAADIETLAERVEAEPLAGLSPLPITKANAGEMLKKIFA